LPVVESLIQVAGASHKGNHIAQFLTMTAFHGSVVTSCLFLTANAGNPLTMKFASDVGIHVTWGYWAVAAFLPAILTLALLPLLLQKILPSCTSHDVARAEAHVKAELTTMGPITKKETIALSIFGLLLLMWSCGHFVSIHPAEAAFVGVSLMLLCKIVTWKDLLQDEISWDTFIWMASLIMMASEMQSLGVVNYFTGYIVS